MSLSTGQMTMQVSLFDGSSWTQSVPTIGIAPSPRTGASAVFIPQCNGTLPGVYAPCVLMFGGQGSSGLLGDVWALWVQSIPYVWTSIAAAQTNAPSPRSGALATLSSNGQYAIFYGGVTSTGPTNDVFMFAPSGLPNGLYSCILFCILFLDCLSVLYFFLQQISIL